jgi:prepilin-type processing-associated H-X9-DG protein
MMTVVLIVLLLISLMIPIFVNLKTNARTAICKNQFRQIGILFNSYQSVNEGHLPNDGTASYFNNNGKRVIGDIKSGKGVEFYQFWNGHLLPYLDTGLASFNRYARVRGDGEVYTYAPPNELNPSNTIKNSSGWVVLRDTFDKGGYGDLKIFVCPEIHANVIDMEYLMSSGNKYRVPRISQLSENWKVTLDWDYLGGGTPTTYVANNKFFGADYGCCGSETYPDSYRLDQVADLSNKALILEGGRGVRDGAGSMPYYFVDYSWYSGMQDGSDLSVSGSFLNASFTTTFGGSARQRLSFPHDNSGEFWVKTGLVVGSLSSSPGIVLEFNNSFFGRAYLAKENYTLNSPFSYSIVSYVYPGDNGELFKNFFASKGLAVPKGFTLFEDKDLSYLAGNMNVLFGDGSVMTKDQAWLCNNRLKIALPSKE